MSTVLVVEDNPDIAILYSRILPGHEVHTVDSAAGALAFLQLCRPDLTILDFHLSGSSGIQVLEHMRSLPHLKNVPIVGISADDLLKPEAKAKGITAFMTKPIDIDQVMTITRNLLANLPTH